MKIVIYNDELRSEMQMYLTLSRQHEVEIAQDMEDLLSLLEEEKADLTFLDLKPNAIESSKEIDVFEIAQKILKKHPQVKVVGICDRDESSLQVKAIKKGISEIITRPIKNRELLEVIAKE